MGTRLKQDAHLYSLLQIINNISICVTTKWPLLLLTMAPVCAKPDSPETMPHVLSSHPSLVDPVTKVLWLEWDKKIPMLEMKHKAKEVSLPWNTQLNTESSQTGMIWKKSGIIPFIMNSVLLQKSTQYCSHKLYFHCTLLVVPLVFYWIPAMVYHIPYQSTRDMLFLMPSYVSTWPVVT